MLQTAMKIRETERLILRDFTPEVYSDVMTSKTDAELKAYFAFTTDEELNAEKERFKKGMTTFNKSFYMFYLIEKSSNKVIGWCGFHTWYLTHSRAEIGYSLNEDEHKGKGYMKEALEAVIAYGFDELKLHRIEAMVGPGNEPSLRLMKHFRFTREGVLREHYFKNGKMEDSIVFSLLRDEYEGRDLITYI